MSPTEIEETYRLVAAYQSKYLADKGVDLPTLRKGANFTGRHLRFRREAA